MGGLTGIAHTRWATHGELNHANAHPHDSFSGRIALFHNGIIENYSPLRQMLLQKGYVFKSTTDSEVLVQLIEFIMESEEVGLLSAVQAALGRVIGSYAIAVIDRESPKTIIAARKSSPLVIGRGDDEFFMASDASAIIDHTSSVIYLDDEEIAVINPGEGLKIVNLDNQESVPVVVKLDISISQLEKCSYEHFMLKEIFEQPRSLLSSVSGRINQENKSVALSGIIDNKERFAKASRIIIVACGTSWHSALIGEHLIEKLCSTGLIPRIN